MKETLLFEFHLGRLKSNGIAFRDAYAAGQDEKRRFLRTVQSLGRCSEEAIGKLAAMSRRKWFPAQTKVVKQGDESDFVCFCMQGQLRVLLETELVEEDKTVNILDDGACFGDWGVVNQLRRSASLATITNAVRFTNTPVPCISILSELWLVTL